MPVTVASCLEPPDGTGDLNPRALWPQAYTATGEGLADVERALAVYIAEGVVRAAPITDVEDNEACVRAWVRYRAFRQRYEAGMVSASSVATDDGYSASILWSQLEAIGVIADAALADHRALLAAAAPALPATVYVPRHAESHAARFNVEW